MAIVDKTTKPHWEMTLFNPFQVLFGINSTGLDQQLQNHSSLTTNTVGNSTLDILNILQFLQGRQ